MEQLTEAERIAAAQVSGVTARYCGTGTITDADRARAIAEMLDIAGKLPGTHMPTARGAVILAREAGLLAGYGSVQEGWRAVIFGLQAELCRHAGADPALIPAWFDAGRARAEAAGQVPCTGSGGVR